ncbi:MAG: 50S ribosomal protein L24 [Mycoplasmatales bacterium]
MFLKQGDNVVVIAGKDKGKEGTITRVLKDKNKVIIENINTYKKHQKAVQGSDGGIIEQEMGIDASNVMLIDPKSKKPTRVGFEIKDGKKVRVSKKSKETI